jgi:hypothetical protein
MAKINIKPNPRTRDVFDDLELFLAFCKKYGFVYREQDLYHTKSYAYSSFLRAQEGKWVRNQWIEDLKKMN